MHFVATESMNACSFYFGSASLPGPEAHCWLAFLTRITESICMLAQFPHLISRGATSKIMAWIPFSVDSLNTVRGVAEIQLIHGHPHLSCPHTANKYNVFADLGSTSRPV